MVTGSGSQNERGDAAQTQQMHSPVLGKLRACHHVEGKAGLCLHRFAFFGHFTKMVVNSM